MPPVVLALCLLQPAGALSADTPAYPRQDLLIEPAELTKPEVARLYRILDARGRNKYLEGHVPGAAWVDHITWSRAFATGQDPATWGKRLGELGIDTDTRVVVYDDNLARDAARIWWILRYWGVRDVRLLNGGWKAWQAAGGKTVTDQPRVAVAAARLTPRTDRLAKKEHMLDWLARKQVQIIDTRSVGEYCGEEQTARRNGAIPRAIHLEWAEVLDPKTQRFKSPQDLARVFRDARVDLDRPGVTYCQSGGRASVLAFAMELMGAKDVRNYYKSWAEWGNADDTPIEKPKPRR